MGTVYYWPMLGRAAAQIRMLEAMGTEFVHVSDRAKMAEHAASFGAQNAHSFAPPIVSDGTHSVSQSTASTLFLGEKLGLVEGITSSAFAVQYMADIVDWSENIIGKNNEDAAKLKAVLVGDGSSPSRVNKM